MDYKFDKDAYNVPAALTLNPSSATIAIDAKQLETMVGDAVLRVLATGEVRDVKVAEARERMRGRITQAVVDVLTRSTLLGDELQKRIPQIAQAVLDCDIRDLKAPSTPHIVEAVTRPQGVLEEQRWNDAILKYGGLSMPTTEDPEQLRARLSDEAEERRAHEQRNAQVAQQRAEAAAGLPALGSRLIPAEYEYDPSLDSYRRGVVHTVTPDYPKGYCIAVNPGRVGVVRNSTPRTITLQVG